MRAALLLAPLACAPAALAEVKPTEADITTMIRVIEARGCVIRDKNDRTVLEAARMTAARAHAAVAALLQDGRAVILNDALHLKTGACR